MNNEKLEVRHANLDGQEISYTVTTTFTIQIGKGKKGSYKNKYCFKGDLIKAAYIYNCLNLNSGFKKRLKMGERTLVTASY